MRHKTKNLVSLILSGLIAAAIFCLCFNIPLTNEAFAEGEASKTITISSADDWEEWNYAKFYNVSNSNTIKKEGGNSVRIDYVHSQTYFIMSLKDPVDASSIQGEKYVEFWFYVLNAYELNRASSSLFELSSSETPDASNADLYHWDLTDLEFQKGWNRVSLKLSEAGVYGRPDLSQIRSVKYTAVVGKRMSVYFDGMVITNAPLAVNSDELGVVAKVPQYEMTNPSGDVSENTVMEIVNTVIIVFAGLAVVGALVTVALVLGNRKNNDRGEE